jgi:hypothetical protein
MQAASLLRSFGRSRPPLRSPHSSGPSIDDALSRLNTGEVQSSQYTRRARLKRPETVVDPKNNVNLRERGKGDQDFGELTRPRFFPKSGIVKAIPEICGNEAAVQNARSPVGPYYLPESNVDFGRLRSAFACALHMHQPLIPAGGGELGTANIVSNLQHMMENIEQGDNHNAPVFLRCYERMGNVIPELVGEGKHPRIMLDYSGCLLYGLRDMAHEQVIESLRRITSQPEYRRCVEWLGTAWGHPVAPSTPVQDFKLHVVAWQQEFAHAFGLEALARVRGFSPPEMALPNHPDVCFEFVKTLRECGYRWVLVQEHTVELEDGSDIRDPHVPNLLVAQNSTGQVATITAIVKTRGSDTKLVGQMQPYYEARGLLPRELGARQIPPLVVQIADGENGGVMMNEFLPKYSEVMREASGRDVTALNVTEWLESLDARGLTEADYTRVRPRLQTMLFRRFQPGQGPARLARVMAELATEDARFRMEGGSWTNDISWVRGYDHLLGPMESASALFAQKALGVSRQDPRFREALFHLLVSQTSCFRYWGSGLWTDYGRELCRRAEELLLHQF